MGAAKSRYSPKKHGDCASLMMSGPAESCGDAVIRTNDPVDSMTTRSGRR